MLYYLHGYQSGIQGEKATLFKKTLHAIPIPYRDGPAEDLVVSQALHRIAQTIHDDPHVVLIGSSLGGLLAACIALSCANVHQLILLNPAIIPPGDNLHLIQTVPLRILKEMRQPRLFSEKIPARITILRGTQDDVVPDHWISSFAQAQQAPIQFYDDDHRFSKNLKKLPVIISTILQQ